MSRRTGFPLGRPRGGRRHPYVRHEATPDEVARFWSHVVPGGDECWVWTGPLMPKGYGHMKVHQRHIYAHRMSYEIHRGEIPFGLIVCHTCDNPPCVNPAHLWLGDARANGIDASLKGRTRNQNSGRTHCRNGHAFDEENTRTRVSDGRLKRLCIICERKGWRERYCRAQSVRAGREAGLTR